MAEAAVRTRPGDRALHFDFCGSVREVFGQSVSVSRLSSNACGPYENADVFCARVGYASLPVKERDTTTSCVHISYVSYVYIMCNVDNVVDDIDYRADCNKNIVEFIE